MKLVLIPSTYEAEPFLKKIGNPKKRALPSGLLLYEGALENGTRIAAAVIGMGMPHSARRAGEALDLLKPDAAWLIGVCGALDPSLKKGDIFLTAAPEDAQTPWKRTVLATATQVINSQEARAQLARETGATCVDMEQSFVAAAARTRGVPFYGLRIISDAVGEEFPKSFGYSYDCERGRYTPLRLACYLARHPSQIGQLRAFLKGCEPVRQKLADELAAHLAGGRRA